MKLIRETCVAGAVIDRTIKLNNEIGKTRAPKTKPTSEAVRKNNDRIAEKRLARLLNANFYPGDLHVTLTYAEIRTEEEQKRILNNFIRRMKREYEKAGREFKWIHVTEYENHRPHHHIVMSYIDLRVIHEQWKEGNIKSSALDKSRNYIKLAQYLIKETSKTFRKASNATKQRYQCSRNMVRPIVIREEMKLKDLYDNPTAITGYSIDEDSIRYYRHPFTAMEHLEYQMVSTDYVPRIKSWRKGFAVKKDETFRRFKEICQLDMGTIIGWSTI